MITYRDATAADAAALARLGERTFVDTFGHLYSAENLALFLATHEEGRWAGQLADPAIAVRVAQSGGALIAYAKVTPPKLPVETGADALELAQFYVAKAWHGKEVAGAMMTWVLEDARRRGARALFLSVFTDNHRARRFYERYGFVTVGTYHFMVGSHADDDLIMRLALD